VSPTRKRSKSKFGLFSLVLMTIVVLVAGAVLFGYRHYTRFADAPIAGIEAGDSVTVAPGDSLPTVVRKLRTIGARGSDLEWRGLARQLGAAGKLQVGEYALEPGMSPRTLLQRMRDGKVVSYRFTIVEGWNFRELRAALAKAKPLQQKGRELDDAALMRAIGRGGQHPEGRFLPETYHYNRGDSDLDLLKRAAADLDRVLSKTWNGRDQGLPLKTPYELLTLASIVEKETGVADERPQIAGVFVRRLKTPMRLETDPTVIYGMGSAYTGNIRKSDLQTDTPYNTYTRDGLPPTPIAMAGADAIHAAAHPAPGDSIFFVAVGDGSGRHVFTKTYAEHQTAVAEYLQRYRQQRAQRQ
jgi:UPF0755 protein